jgi:hypothetical protein
LDQNPLNGPAHDALVAASPVPKPIRREFDVGRLRRDAHPRANRDAGSYTDADERADGHTHIHERTNSNPHGDRHADGRTTTDESVHCDGNPYLRGNRRSNQSAIATDFWFV